MASAAEVTPADLIKRSARIALELLPSAGCKQHQGIHQGAKDLGHRLSPRSRWRLWVLVESAALLRHITRYSVATFLGESRFELATLLDAKGGVQAQPSSTAIGAEKTGVDREFRGDTTDTVGGFRKRTGVGEFSQRERPAPRRSSRQRAMATLQGKVALVTLALCLIRVVRWPESAPRSGQAPALPARLARSHPPSRDEPPWLRRALFAGQRQGRLARGR